MKLTDAERLILRGQVATIDMLKVILWREQSRDWGRPLGRGALSREVAVDSEAFGARVEIVRTLTAEEKT